MVRTLKKKIGRRRAACGAIEIFDRGARIAVISRRKGRTVVSDLVEVRFPTPAGDEKVPVSVKGALVREALRSRGWRIGRMALVVPKNVVTLRVVTLPSNDDAEIAEMARFEAQKHIPFNVERHVIAHSVLSKEGVEGTRTLVVAVDRAALEEPLAICREAKIELDSARVSSLAIVDALMLDPPEDFERETYALVNIGWATVDITIVSNGMIQFTRSGTMGIGRIAPHLQKVLGTEELLTRDQIAALDARQPEDFFVRKGRPKKRPTAPFRVEDFGDEETEPAAEGDGPVISLVGPEKPGSNSHAGGSSGPAGEVRKWLDRLVQEIERTWTFGSREFDLGELGAVYLAGLGSYITGLTDYLAAKINSRIVLLPPPASLEFESAELREAWREYALTGGAAVGETLPSVNLLPQEYLEEIEARRRRRSYAVSGMLVFVLMVLGVAYAARVISDQRHQLEFYEAHNKKLAPRARELRDKERRFRLIKRIIDDPLSAGAVLERITHINLIAQRKVALIEYHYVKGEGVVLEGHARSYADLEKFTGELGKLGCFDVVTQKSRSPQKLSHGRPTVIKFTLECRFPQSGGR